MTFKLRLRTASHHVTWFLGTQFPETFPLVFVVGYPKSGTTWVCQLVADYLQLPFPRFSLLPVGCPAVVHGHERVRRRYPRCVYVLRDGRDALVSQYFYLARDIPEGDHPKLTVRQRRLFPGLVNKANVHDNIAGFVQRMMKRPQSARANWGVHARSLFEKRHSNAVLLRYEDLINDGELALSDAMTRLTGRDADGDRVREAIRKFAFKRQANRRPARGERAGFLRKGEPGDWARCFSREAAEIFDRHCGDMLIAAGYEKDHTWVDADMSPDDTHAADVS